MAIGANEWAGSGVWGNEERESSPAVVDDEDMITRKESSGEKCK
jgi:hypothetical protein